MSAIERTLKQHVASYRIVTVTGGAYRFAVIGVIPSFILVASMEQSADVSRWRDADESADVSARSLITYWLRVIQADVRSHSVSK